MLQLHGAIYRPDSFVLILRYCANLKAIRYEPTSLNRIRADKSHCNRNLIRAILLSEALRQDELVNSSSLPYTASLHDELTDM